MFPELTCVLQSRLLLPKSKPYLEHPAGSFADDELWGISFFKTSGQVSLENTRIHDGAALTCCTGLLPETKNKHPPTRWASAKDDPHNQHLFRETPLSAK